MMENKETDKEERLESMNGSFKPIYSLTDALDDKRKEKDKISENAPNVMEVVNALGDVGKAGDFLLKMSSQKEDWNKSMNGIKGLSNVLRGVFKLTSGSDDPQIQQLESLGRSVSKLGEVISDGFDDMKAFITEHTFFVKIVNPTSVLTKFMRDVYDYPGENSIENFMQAYKKNTPLTLAYNLLSYLQQDAMNPVQKALDAENPKTMKTYRKWYSTFARLFGLLRMLETFAMVVQGKTSEFRVKKVLEAMSDADEKIRRLRDVYLREAGPGFWYEMDVFLKKEIKNCTPGNKKEKAEMFAKKLESYFTKDAFYICIFNNGEYNKWYAAHCEDRKRERKMISNFNTDIVVYIYRSTETDHWENYHFQKVKQQVIECGKHPLKYKIDKPMDTLIHDQIRRKEEGIDEGFVLLTRKRSKSHFLVANYPGREKGPGYWDLVTTDPKKPFSKRFLNLVIALP